MRDKITFQLPVKSETEYSASEVIYEDYFSTYARVSHIRGNRAVEANEIVNTYTVRIEIRLYHKVDYDMVIVHDGIRYRILDINPERSKNCITITGERINE